MSRRKKPAPEPEPAIRTEEGFDMHRTPMLSLCYLKRTPDVFNGSVHVYRYRHTVERIEEPREVIFARIAELYRATTNHHDRTALREEATRLGTTIEALLKEYP